MPSPGSPYFSEFCTVNPTTQASQNADILPTATATWNGVDDSGFVLSVTNLATGRYSVSGTVPVAYVAGDWVSISVSITITDTSGTITTADVIDEFQVESVTAPIPPPTPTTPLLAPDIGLLSVVYATDEAIAIRAGGDWGVLCPDWQKLAFGVQGVFLSGTPWTLASTEVNFLGAGIQPRHVIHLTKPVTAYKGQGEYLAVDTVNEDGSVTLRRLGTPSGFGSPPGQGGVTNVHFHISTLLPQIEKASYYLNRKFNIDPAWAGRRPADIYDLRDLEYATVLWTLKQRYHSENRTNQGDFAIKMKAIEIEWLEVLDRLSIRWITANGPGDRQTNVFSTRCVR